MTEHRVRIIVAGWRGDQSTQSATMKAARYARQVRLQLAGTVNQWFWNTYSEDRNQPDPFTVIHGRCHLGGVDLWADQAARSFGWEVEQYPAENFGTWPGCGPRRSRHMCSLGADLLIAWPHPSSTGTFACIKVAVEYGIPAVVHPLPMKEFA